MSGQWPPEWEDPDDGRSDAGLPDGQRLDDGHSDLELSEVASLLASVRGPALPASFEARISAAIAAEAAARATSPGAAATEPAEAPSASPGADDAEGTDRSANPEEFFPATAGGGPATSARRQPRRGSRASRSAAASSGPGDSRPGTRRRRLRMPSMQAAGWTLVCCLVLGGFGLLVTHGSGSSSSSAAISSPADQPAASSAGTSAGQKPDTEHAAGTLPEAASSTQPATGDRSGFLVYSTGTAYQRSTLASQVRAELDSPALGRQSLATPANSADATATAPAASASASAAGPSAGRSTPSRQLAGCVSQVTGDVAPSLVDKATYDGIPAYIIAVPTQVWVVRRGCTAADTQLLTRIPLNG
jgi:hypothetical protein